MTEDSDIVLAARNRVKINRIVSQRLQPIISELRDASGWTTEEILDAMERVVMGWRQQSEPRCDGCGLTLDAHRTVGDDGTPRSDALDCDGWRPSSTNPTSQRTPS